MDALAAVDVELDRKPLSDERPAGQAKAGEAEPGFRPAGERDGVDRNTLPPRLVDGPLDSAFVGKPVAHQHQARDSICGQRAQRVAHGRLDIGGTACSGLLDLPQRHRAELELAQSVPRACGTGSPNERPLLRALRLGNALGDVVEDGNGGVGLANMPAGAHQGEADGSHRERLEHQSQAPEAQLPFPQEPYGHGDQEQGRPTRFDRHGALPGPAPAAWKGSAPNRLPRPNRIQS